MSTEKEIIRELNIVFEKLGWKLLPENNEYSFNKAEYAWTWVIFNDSFIYIDRTYIPYEKYTNKFTIKELDNYVVEFIKNICLKYKLEEIRFKGRNYESNSIIIK